MIRCVPLDILHKYPIGGLGSCGVVCDLVIVFPCRKATPDNSFRFLRIFEDCALFLTLVFIIYSIHQAFKEDFELGLTFSQVSEIELLSFFLLSTADFPCFASSLDE